MQQFLLLDADHSLCIIVIFSELVVLVSMTMTTDGRHRTRGMERHFSPSDSCFLLRVIMVVEVGAVGFT